MSRKKKTDASHTPLAVALNYDGKGAPRVTAKGRGSVAEAILNLAREHDIPLDDDPELALALSQVPLGEEIPEALYVAVAEVLAFTYMLEGRMPPGRGKGGTED